MSVAGHPNRPVKRAEAQSLGSATRRSFWKEPQLATTANPCRSQSPGPNLSIYDLDATTGTFGGLFGGEPRARQRARWLRSARRVSCSVLDDARRLYFVPHMLPCLSRRARSALDIFAASPERDALTYLPDYVLSRDR